jgi:hypothetical protein
VLKRLVRLTFLVNPKSPSTYEASVAGLVVAVREAAATGRATSCLLPAVEGTAFPVVVAHPALGVEDDLWSILWIVIYVM